MNMLANLAAVIGHILMLLIDLLTLLLLLRLALHYRAGRALVAVDMAATPLVQQCLDSMGRLAVRLRIPWPAAEVSRLVWVLAILLALRTLLTLMR